MPLVIVQPAPNARFNIDATPRMPTIPCRAQITGVQPDPTANTAFDWAIEITEAVAVSSCASARVGSCRLTAAAPNQRGGNWTPVFNRIQGGSAVIRVTARPATGAPLQATVNVLIRGQNPGTGAITNRLGGAGSVGDQIACLESGRRQFDGGGMPLLGPGGDVGVMQLCNPGASCDERWDWSANVAAGLALIASKQAEAQNALNQHRVQGHYPNDSGLDDAGVLLYDTIQRYNTGRGYWTWDGTANQWQATPSNQYVAQVLGCR